MKKTFRASLLDASARRGLDLRTLKTTLGGLKRHVINTAAFRRDLAEFERQRRLASDCFEDGPISPRLEGDDPGGTATGHYFHQDLLVARKIYRAAPRRHLDVGSRVDGFVAHVAVFREIEIIDIRPLRSSVPNIKVQVVDLSAPLPSELLACCDSLSCLHALEHFGLGRYGDPIRVEGHRDGFRNLHAMLQPRGVLYFSVPMGPQRIEFNSHRVFSLRFLMSMIEPLYNIRGFSYVGQDGNLRENINLADPVHQSDIDLNFGCTWGCAIFELGKR